MMGLCPHCGIKLNKPPFGERETSELLLTLSYRKIIENNKILKNFYDLGYCELCRATKKEKEEQNKLEKINVHNS